MLNLNASPVVFGDPDGDALTYIADTDAPNIALVAMTGNILTVTPSAVGSATITVAANDGKGETESTSFVVTVVAENLPPVVTNAIPNQTLLLGGLSFTRDLNASPTVFRDSNRDVLSYVANSSVSNIAEVSISGSVLVVAPVNVGNATITVIANDGRGTTASTSFTVSVLSENRPPIVANVIHNQNLSDSGSPFIRDLNDSPVVFSDPDGDLLFYTVRSSSPNTAATNISGSTIAVVPLTIGNAIITITADDGRGTMTSTAFNVTVGAGLNQPPILTNTIPNQSLTVGGKSFIRNLDPPSAVFVDPDGDTLIYTTNSNVQSIVTAGISGNILTITPVAIGDAIITVTANDNKGGMSLLTFTVTVHGNQPPTVVNAIPPHIVTIGDSVYTRDLNAAPAVFNDPDGDTLTYLPTSSNPSIAVSAVVNSILTVSAIASGNVLITVFASDRFGGTVLMTFGVTTNRRPIVLNQGLFNNISLTRGEASFTRDLSTSPFTFDDLDGDELSYSVASLYDSVAIAAISEHVVLTILPIAAGDTKVTVEANDKRGGKEKLIVNILVKNPKAGPAITPQPFFLPQPENQDIVINAQIRDTSGVADANLYYRKGGEILFAKVPLRHPALSLFSGTISGNDVTPLGIDYYFEAMNGEGAKTRKPLSGVYAIQIETARGVTKEYAQPSGSEQIAYRLISVPLELKDKSPRSVLEDDLGVYKNTEWRFYELRVNYLELPANVSIYSEFPNTSEMRPGKAFWIIVKEVGKRISTSAGISIRTDTLFTIPLHRGWNFIGNPFYFPIPLSKVRLQKTQQSPVLRYYESKWNVTQSDSVREIVPFEGYALAVDSPDTLLINPDLTDTTNLLSKTKHTLFNQALRWSIQIVAQCQEARDIDNIAAVAPNASYQYDEFDLPEPPVIGEYVSVSFPHRDWNKFAKTYCLDARPEPTAGEIWEFEVKTNISDKVNLTFEDLESVPLEFEVWLTDDALRVTQNLRQTNGYTVAGSENPKILKLVVGKSDFIKEKLAQVQLIPTHYELSQNFPNPFNPVTTIRYGLPQAGCVSLKIFNLLGEEVATLVDNEQKAAGYHVAIWDGRDRNGVYVASGVYAYRIRMGSFSSSKKLAMIR